MEDLQLETEPNKTKTAATTEKRKQTSNKKYLSSKLTHNKIVERTVIDLCSFMITAIESREGNLSVADEDSQPRADQPRQGRSFDFVI